jgi:PKD repeat protein
VGAFNSLDLDAAGKPHVCYYDDTNDDLKYARLTENGWAVETVDSDGSVGWYSSLALDVTDNPHISYYDDTNEDLKYAMWDGNQWISQAVDTTDDVGTYTSLELDAFSNPYISYYDNTNDDLKYARLIENAWTVETVDDIGTVGWFTSLALDIAGNPHISYFDATYWNLKYARFTEGVWSIETADDAGNVGRYNSLAVDAAGNPHIAYFDDIEGDLRYTTSNGSTWNRESVDSIVGDRFSISALGLMIEGRFDTPESLTGDYMVFYCGGTLIFPASTGIWTASLEQIAAPEVPFLVSPGDEEEGVLTNPNLIWNASARATSYHLQLSTMESFSTTIVDQSDVTDTTYAVGTLANDNTYFWRVNATNTNGTSDWSTTFSFTTKILTANFSADTTSGLVPLTVQFSDSSTGEITDWLWDFGDGQTSTEQHPSHTYETADTFSVSLTVTNPDGSATITRDDYIIVLELPPMANFGADTTSGYLPFTVQFSDSSTGKVENWFWEFGDNKTSTEQHPSHTYATADTFSVSLTVIGPGGRDTKTTDDYIIVLEPPPLAIFEADTTIGDLPFTVQFTDSSTGKITTWFWEFGDDGTSTEQNPSHTYETADTFSVSLSIMGPGGSDTITRDNYIIVRQSTMMEDYTINIPNKYHLYQNYPNPFNPSTQIKFALPKSEHGKIEVYGLIGQKIKTLLNKSMPAGYHKIEFNGQNLSSGIYIYRIEAGEFQDVKKMIILR